MAIDQDLTAEPDSEYRSAFAHLQLSHVSYEQGRPCLTEVRLDIQPGEFLLIVGTSGSGKSTLAYCLNGIVPHVMGSYEGSVQIRGRDAKQLTMADIGQNIGLVMQDPDSQLCNLYVLHEVAFGPENLVLLREEVMQRTNEALKFVGIEDLANRFVFGMSGGQKQKVAIASVIAMRPQLVIFDEPTANLDPMSSQEILKLIGLLRREGLAVVVIESKVDYFAARADRVVALHEGRVVAQGQPKEVFADSRVHQTGIWIPQVSEVELRLREHGVEAPNFPISVDEAATLYRQCTFSKQPVARMRSRSRAAPDQPVIQVKDLHYAYDDGHEALKGVDLEVHAGEWLAVVGPNGSGKDRKSVV